LNYCLSRMDGLKLASLDTNILRASRMASFITRIYLLCRAWNFNFLLLEALLCLLLEGFSKAYACR
jgi:hypothetical protein